MSKIRQTPVTMNGKKGVIMHDSMCADGPVDPVTKEPLIDPSTGKPYPGKNDDMADLIHKYLVKIRSSVNLSDYQGVPRFGVLSLLAMNTPIYCYDHPRLKKLANTAFTDGISVFIDADFMRKLHQQEEESEGTKFGVVWTILHELMHKLSMHTTRMRNMDPVIANIAQDLVINGKLIKGFGKQIPPVPLLEEMTQGTNEQSAEKYHKMAEEVVAEMLLIEERKKQQKKEKQKQKQQGGGGGQGQPSPGGEGGEEEGDSQEQDKNSQKSKNQKSDAQKPGQKGGQPQSGDGQGQRSSGGEGGEEEGEEEEKEFSEIHHITPEELIKVLEEEGLMDTVGKALDYPASDDVEGIGKLKEKDKLNTIDAVQTAMSQASKCGGQYPGQHIAEEASLILEGLEKGKLTWKLGIKKHIMGDGQKLRTSDDEAALPWHLSKEVMGVDPWYEGALVPVGPDETVLCLIDMSGSTGRGRMRQEFASECLTLMKGVSSGGDTARKVIIMSADTVLRGEPVMVTESNIHTLMKEGVPVFGDGGTCFVNCLKEALALPMLKKEKIKSVIYFTDCEDAVPQREQFEEYLNKGMKIVFVTTPGCWNEEWNKRITWAEVYCIEDNTQVDLEKTEDQNTTNTRRNKM